MEINRNGLRTIAVGTGEFDRLDLPFLPNNADVSQGDLLVTSGLGGAFPAGYPVAVVDSVTRIPQEPFAAVSAKNPPPKLNQVREIMLIWSIADEGDRGVSRMTQDRASRRLTRNRLHCRGADAGTIAPMPDWASPFRPDWVALTLIYWTMMLPRTYSIGTAWIVGIVLDVAQGTLLGQHAIALCFVAYIAVKFHLQFRVFPVSQMSATVFATSRVFTSSFFSGSTVSPA